MSKLVTTVTAQEANQQMLISTAEALDVLSSQILVAVLGSWFLGIPKYSNGI